MQLATIVPTRDRSKVISYNVLACCATREPRHHAQDAGTPVYQHAVDVEFNCWQGVVPRVYQAFSCTNVIYRIHTHLNSVSRHDSCRQTEMADI